MRIALLLLALSPAFLLQACGSDRTVVVQPQPAAAVAPADHVVIEHHYDR